MYPSIHVPYPSISEAMSRILHVVIEPLYAPLSPAVKLFEGYTPKYQQKQVTNTTNFKLCYADPAKLVAKRSSSGLKFFYDDWKSNIPRYEDPEMLLKVLRGLLTYVGPHLSKDARLMVKLIRLGRSQLSDVRLAFLAAI